MTERPKPTVEPTGPYRPGLVVVSDKDYEQPKSGISTFDAKTGKTKEK